MDNDWIEWHGGECPVPVGTRVDVQLRSGNRFLGEEAFVAGDSHWLHDGDRYDIMFYRIAKHAKPPAPDTAALNALWQEYAKAAMSGMFADPEFNHPVQSAAELVADMADAMLAETVKRGRV